MPGSGLCDAFRHEASRNLVQLCEVQSCGWSSRASSRSGRVGVRSLLAPASCMRNEFLSFLDSASAAPLSAPGMCCALDQVVFCCEQEQTAHQLHGLVTSTGALIHNGHHCCIVTPTSDGTVCYDPASIGSQPS